jgi:AmmeMemoRadiSam system protein B/AmmeMemoRadiSam system protein A
LAEAEVPRESAESSRVFVSPLAGAWYDADKEKLADEIDEYVAKATGERLDNVCALILPHAGYRYSGPTAAYAVRQVRGRSFKRVIVMGPSHRTRLENVASVPDFTHYATPLGRVPLDRPFIAELRKHRLFQNVPRAHEDEHSVQIELPLLQRALGDFPFVPIVVGELDRPTVRRMAAVLRGLIDSQTLVVASSDFTHYGRNYGYVPFRDDVPDNLKKLDTGAFDLIGKKDVDGLFDYIDETGTTVCGRYPIGVLLSMLPADARVHRLHYDTSGRMLGDYSNSVSYGAFAVTGKWPVTQRVVPKPEASSLSPADKARLLKLARGTLTYVLENWRMPTPEQLNVEVTPAMKQVSGVFVTLHKEGELRGCIGEIFPARPLYKGVIAQAINAGLNDRRFPRVKSSELGEIDFQISVLTPPCPVTSVADIVVGKHGVVLKKAGRSAVFLPQVAVEQNWDRETMLTHLAQKAGLPGDGWREGASFDVFEAIVFDEEDE